MENNETVGKFPVPRPATKTKTLEAKKDLEANEATKKPRAKKPRAKKPAPEPILETSHIEIIALNTRTLRATYLGSVSDGDLSKLKVFVTNRK